MTLVVPLVIGALVLALLTVYSSIHRIEEGELGALLVFGRMQRVLEPGVHFAWPYFSETYPIDRQTMTIEKGDERIDVPDRFEKEVKTADRSSAADGHGGQMISELHANRVAHLLYVVALIEGWVGAIILTAHFTPRFGGMPQAAPVWIGVVLIAMFLPLIHLGNVIGRRLGSFPPDAGAF